MTFICFLAILYFILFCRCNNICILKITKVILLLFVLVISRRGVFKITKIITLFVFFLEIFICRCSIFKITKTIILFFFLFFSIFKVTKITPLFFSFFSFFPLYNCIFKITKIIITTFIFNLVWNDGWFCVYFQSCGSGWSSICKITKVIIFLLLIIVHVTFFVRFSICKITKIILLLYNFVRFFLFLFFHNRNTHGRQRLIFHFNQSTKGITY
mmetsp:Transcript_9902/g.14742  ORF Transcript_9902/g.14742 Transcript_9902/m.14742 type:complete len:214 (-) Transcript_9902:65-706(-)